ncbi:hypothetical protein [Sphingomonas oligophenolica]|uniref:Uncharacterized protein n=1 Tax=Sphingomonas oligophenolica TaxID=301154 RepID=A0A502CC10_9SPHN|nr:hypothetical protein [Sphingomonas oligophenolica]TPG10363.1 hypothetical protein EAH84_12310 [Sphingomonas oligophenolica]
MADYVSTDPAAPRGNRTGFIIAGFVVAFVAGLVLMGYAMKHVPFFGGARSKISAVASGKDDETRDEAAGFSPAAPLNANGESPAVASPTDPVLLATREAALAAQLTSLEARTAGVSADAAAARGQATRAEGLLIAFAARRALDRGLGLGYIEDQLRNRFGGVQPRAVIYVIQASRNPVTLEDLRQGLDAIAPDISTVRADNWWRSLQRELSNLVVLRKAGTPSPLPADRLARAKRLLEGGQVEAALGEVKRLPGASDAANWTTAANRYVTARHALDLIENAAILGRAAAPPPPPAGGTATDPQQLSTTAPEPAI